MGAALSVQSNCVNDNFCIILKTKRCRRPMRSREESKSNLDYRSKMETQPWEDGFAASQMNREIWQVVDAFFFIFWRGRNRAFSPVPSSARRRARASEPAKLEIDPWLSNMPIIPTHPSSLSHVRIYTRKTPLCRIHCVRPRAPQPEVWRRKDCVTEK